jgi:formylglycine-generating enzyme required for sulfatase activity
LKDQPALIRCRVGSTLGRLGDPRFHDETLFCLPKDPMLGFIEIPAGEFVMGSTKDDQESFSDERPQHRLELARFFAARYPTTVAQFAAFAAASKYDLADPRCLRGVANHPVALVTWHDAMAYCRWLTESMRRSPRVPAALKSILTIGQGQVVLPSEAEWERVARGTRGRRYPWGEDIDSERANYSQTGIGRTSPVGAFPRGGTPAEEGQAEDLGGNVWEWTRSTWGDYPYHPGLERENLAAPDDVLRVVRGGAFSNLRRSVRAAYRGRDEPDYRDWIIGFRVVVSPFSSGL